MMRRLSAASVMERLDIRSRETLRQLVKSKRLPEPIRDTEKGPRYWLEDEISNFIASQAERRHAGKVASDDQLGAGA